MIVYSVAVWLVRVNLVNFSIAAFPLVWPSTTNVPDNLFAFSESFAILLESVFTINVIALPLSIVFGPIKFIGIFTTGFPYWSDTLAWSIFLNGLLTIVVWGTGSVRCVLEILFRYELLSSSDVKELRPRTPDFKDS